MIFLDIYQNCLFRYIKL